MENMTSNSSAEDVVKQQSSELDESTWSNKPANVSVSMAVTDILKIEEVDHTYTMKFRLVLEW